MWTVRWSDDGSLSQTWDAHGPWLRFRGVFDVHVVGQHLFVRVRSSPDLVVRGVVDLVVPMLRYEAGALGLHAAAFGGPDGVTLLLGPNGAGKSTLTAVAAAAGRPVLADDCVVVDVRDGIAWASRGVPAMGVSPAVAAALGFVGPAREDDEDDKVDVAIAPDHVAPVATRLRRIVLLGERGHGQDLAEEPVGGATALAEVAEQCHAGLLVPAPLEPLERLGALVDALPVVRARAPEGLDAARDALDRSGW